MADQTINPVSPTNRTRDVLKKKKDEQSQKHPRPRDKVDDKKQEKKGIIDTYA
ncbi:MAG: hypothetical protein QNJ69_07135 [Gammaproteobacteria bacterium]|nr:hypothetical protein [Gammaproteobacteria bacterium]